ncbi:MAG: sigma-70 family RNA polymerase sigma factor [Fibrobacteria bacterium]|nr:sigma-70 family RNA polymerase sigma factor [Fibrobacteria bacterium]
MKLEIYDNNLELPYVADSLIARKCYKLERMLNKFPPDSITLTCEYSPASRKKFYQLTLDLKVPEGGIKVNAVEKSLVNVSGAAFKKLFRSVSQLKKTMRSRGEYEQKSKTAERSLKDTTLLDDARIKLADFYGKNYGDFYNYALREIRFISYQGYTKLGSVDVIDILNEALLKVANLFNQEYDGENVRRLYFKEIKKTINRQLKRGGVALVPVEQAIEPEDIDTAYHEYYQPDEIIKVEDILIDADSILPEQKVEYDAIESHIDKLLAQLPDEWRNAFILCVREGIPIEDIACNRGLELEAIKKDLEEAKNFIRQKLADSGFHWNEQN